MEKRGLPKPADLEGKVVSLVEVSKHKEGAVLRIAKEAFFEQAKEDLVAAFEQANEEANAHVLAFACEVLRHDLEEIAYFDDDEQAILFEKDLMELLSLFVPKIQELFAEDLLAIKNGDKVRRVQTYLAEEYSITAEKDKRMSPKEVQGLLQLSIEIQIRLEREKEIKKEVAEVVKERKRHFCLAVKDMITQYFARDHVQVMGAVVVLEARLEADGYFVHAENVLHEAEDLYELLCPIMGRVSEKEQARRTAIVEARRKRRKDELDEYFMDLSVNKADFVLAVYNKFYPQFIVQLEEKGYFVQAEQCRLSEDRFQSDFIKFIIARNGFITDVSLLQAVEAA